MLILIHLELVGKVRIIGIIGTHLNVRENCNSLMANLNTQELLFSR